MSRNLASSLLPSAVSIRTRPSGCSTSTHRMASGIRFRSSGSIRVFQRCAARRRTLRHHPAAAGRLRVCGSGAAHGERRLKKSMQLLLAGILARRRWHRAPRAVDRRRYRRDSMRRDPCSVRAPSSRASISNRDSSSAVTSASPAARCRASFTEAEKSAQIVQPAGAHAFYQAAGEPHGAESGSSQGEIPGAPQLGADEVPVEACVVGHEDPCPPAPPRIRSASSAKAGRMTHHLVGDVGDGADGTGNRTLRVDQRLEHDLTPAPVDHRYRDLGDPVPNPARAPVVSTSTTAKAQSSRAESPAPRGPVTSARPPAAAPAGLRPAERRPAGHRWLPGR